MPQSLECHRVTSKCHWVIHQVTFECHQATILCLLVMRRVILDSQSTVTQVMAHEVHLTVLNGSLDSPWWFTGQHSMGHWTALDGSLDSTRWVTWLHSKVTRWHLQGHSTLSGIDGVVHVVIPHIIITDPFQKKECSYQCIAALVFTGSSSPSHLWPHWPCMEVISAMVAHRDIMQNTLENPDLHAQRQPGHIYHW